MNTPAGEETYFVDIIELSSKDGGPVRSEEPSMVLMGN